MAHLPEESKFDEGVYQLEMTDPVVGGPNGISNSPLRNLANRTRWLKDQLTTALTGKADRESPQLTGEPTTTTPGESDNSTRIASTGWVRSQVSRLAAPIAHVGSRGAAHAEATSTQAGFMSAADKVKLNGVDAGAQPNTVISVAGKTGAVTLAVGDVSGALASSHAGAGGNAHALATTSQAGFMSAADKTKLDRVSSGAGAVTSVAGRTGAVTLSVSDVSGAAPKASPTFSGNVSVATNTQIDLNENGTRVYVPTKSLSSSSTGATEAASKQAVTDYAAPKVNASFSGTTNFSGTVVFDANGDARGRTWPVTDNSISFATTAWVRSAMSDISSKAGFVFQASDYGYIKLPSWLGGFMLQWTKISTANRGHMTGSWPTAFPNKCVTTFASARHGSAWTVASSPRDRTTFNWESPPEKGGLTVTAHIIGIGH